MITYSLEDLSDSGSIGNIKKLMGQMFIDHYEEVACNKSLQKLDPDYDKYLSGVHRKIIRVFLARSEEKIVGYCITLLSPSLHYKAIKYAVNDVFYVSPEHRGTMIGPRLLSMATKDARVMGASIYFMEVKSEHKFDKLLIRNGFKNSQVMWSKVL